MKPRAIAGHLVLLAVASFIAGAGAIRILDHMEEAMTPVTHTYPCLPEDKCLLHIVPLGKPELALTCDLQSNKCWDDKP